MEKERKRRKLPSEEHIKKMIRYRKQGLTYKEIGEKTDFHYCTVYRFTKNILVDRERAKVKRELIVALLKDKKTVKEVASLANATKDYVRKIQSSKESKVDSRKEEVEKVKNNRQKEIEKINKELRRQKEKQEKEWEEQLKEDRKILKERYPYAFN